MSRYTLKVITGFAAAHTLRDYPGDCRRMHGHNWKVEVEVVASALDELGMGVDFKSIKREAKAQADLLDHSYINEIEPFDRLNPTAENLAAWFHQGMSERLNNERVRVSAVTLWETETACVRYTEED